jgi:hypothetical protein
VQGPPRPPPHAVAAHHHRRATTPASHTEREEKGAWATTTAHHHRLDPPPSEPGKKLSAAADTYTHRWKGGGPKARPRHAGGSSMPRRRDAEAQWCRIFYHRPMPRRYSSPRGEGRAEGRGGGRLGCAGGRHGGGGGRRIWREGEPEVGEAARREREGEAATGERESGGGLGLWGLERGVGLYRKSIWARWAGGPSLLRREPNKRLSVKILEKNQN